MSPQSRGGGGLWGHLGQLLCVRVAGTILAVANGLVTEGRVTLRTMAGAGPGLWRPLPALKGLSLLLLW